MKFAILSDNPKTARLQEIIDKFIDKKVDTYYYDVNTRKYEKAMVDLCKKNNIKTECVPRACAIAHFVFVIYEDKTERVRNEQ
jgi:hypothetical protein